ncbi:hypothetical protein P167DRAFT_528185 [Morchella conica CCBAS932]|uniref:mRNA 3'-end-processing protein n=1 Tax=Morchella conica CCBAS932 TaxID=1392247 RepID=A0A3N4KDR0_9PEZI|nr:hypothetical protein P167DRAFT_528185 [Morchella conica CCBAS932]
MATTAGAAPSTPSIADRILNPQQQFAGRFAFNDFLRKEYRFGLDPNRRTCPLFVQGHCPMGNSCPDKHAVSSSFNNLVCKHWLRSLCKKGEACEFLHEYNLRKMPECNFFVRNGYCSNGEECLYLHVDPDSKIPLCPHYENGFCPLGPTCSKKHVRKPICKFYLAGFCPDGRQACKEGAHPRWTTGLAPPTVRKPREEREEGGDIGMEGGRDRGRGDGGDRGDRGFGGRGGFEGRRRYYGGRGGGRRDRDR